jgi:hypothetical protein
MRNLPRLLRYWWKEECHAPANPKALRTAHALAVLLLAPLFLIHLHQRSLAGQADQRQRLQEGLAIAEVAYGPLSRASLDWGHWDSLYRYILGANPNFPRTDMQITALFDGGMLLLLLLLLLLPDQNGLPLLNHAVRQHRPKEFRALVRCANADLHEMKTVFSALHQLCRDGDGNPYLGIATPISNSTSIPPASRHVGVF